MMLSEYVNQRRTDTTMAKRKSTKGQTTWSSNEFVTEIVFYVHKKYIKQTKWYVKN